MILGIVAELARWEGVAQHMYVCTAGRVTTAIGHMMPTTAAAKLLPWRRADGSLALPDAVERGYAAVLAKGPGKKASAYEDACPLRITMDDVRDLTVRRLEGEFLPGLRKMFPNWAYIPEPAQNVLIDLAWNLGLTGLSKFRRLADAVAHGDWYRAALSCSVKTSRPERNEWRAATLAKLAPRPDA